MRSLPLVKLFTPIVLLPNTPSLERAGHVHKNWIMDHVDTHGAVLLRNFESETDPASSFSRLMETLSLKAFTDTAESAAPRTPVATYVWTANEAPHDALIPFHHEMAQSANPPRYVGFFCENPPKEGEGRTPIVRSRDIASELRRSWPRCAEELDRRGVRYVRTLPEDDDLSSPIGKSWTTSFQTTTKEVCERDLVSKGFKVCWNSDGSLTTMTPSCKVFDCDSIGRETFFNSIVAARTGWNDDRNVGTNAVVFGDGSHLTFECRAMLDYAASFMEEEAVRITWKAGDALILDNRQVLHARETFDATTHRRILASLWGPRVLSSTL